MSSRPSTFRQRDIERAIRAARNAGETGEVRVELMDAQGNRIIVTSREGEEPQRGASEWRKRVEALP